ncbi:WXG100 family type VII secretion target [Paractinoplanes lichenicola]|uniref:WXG100 family type VII secretion target n=1 Tax=Paractinoplanes lichenicola TaxID=2802976 RepID=A0ABS1VUP6_9ACTN|nr:WXG100 family type VII secretion target [Actinoplanes lichenicola]MBL7258148.1 WXG100 family type VII secretion target [Actinoplanes lichenicola]
MSDVANPLIAEREDSTRWFSGIFLAEDIDSLMASFNGGGWIDPAIGGIAAGLDALAFVTDPLGQLVSWGVGWLIEHVKPLSDALDALAGDPDQINAYAQTWNNVSGAMNNAGTTLHDGAVQQIATWTGVAARSYRHVVGEHEAALQALGKATAALGQLTAGAGMLVATVRMMVRDLIADFVSVLAVRLWEWLAEAGLTLGLGTPWVIAQVSTLVGKWAGRIAKLLDGLVGSLRRLTPMMRTLEKTIDEIKAVLRRLGRGADTPGGTPARDTHLFHAEADPLRRHGPARETHPAEWEAAMREAEEAGVEVIVRDGAMAYGPAPPAGNPGQMILDPDASYGALLHEMSHLRDDRAAGWEGMAGAMGDPRARYENEARAYQQEIDYARSIGDQESVDRLHQLLRQEYEYIFGEAPP